MTGGGFTPEISIPFIESAFYVRFIRSNQTWHVVEAFSGINCCLETLALEKNYRVSSVCVELGCSERYLYAVFVRDIGLPPKTWMNLERMVVARRKLEGGKSIVEVAKDLGFLSVEAFNRRFYNVYRVSPVRFVQGRKTFDPTKPLAPRELREIRGRQPQMSHGDEEE